MQICSTLSMQLTTRYNFNRNIFTAHLTEDVSVACPFGGSFTFGPSDAGEAYTFENCAYTQGFVLNGSGGYDYDSGIMTFDTKVTGVKEGNLVYTDNFAESTDLCHW